MELKFNVTGSERKALVTAIAEITGEKAKYKGMPSAAFEIGEYIVDRDGTLITENADMNEFELLVERLAENGFEAEIEQKDEEPTGTSIQMPLTKFNETQLQNLYNLVNSKTSLIKKALGIAELPINIIDNRLDFPWFPANSAPDEIKAYMHLVTGLCDLARKQKRVSAKETEVENEKYAFRCFLLRLGFIGDEFKVERKILLQNFTGSAAFKNGGKNNEVSN